VIVIGHQIEGSLDRSDGRVAVFHHVVGSDTGDDRKIVRIAWLGPLERLALTGREIEIGPDRDHSRRLALDDLDRNR